MLKADFYDITIVCDVSGSGHGIGIYIYAWHMTCSNRITLLRKLNGIEWSVLEYIIFSDIKFKFNEEYILKQQFIVAPRYVPPDLFIPTSFKFLDSFID